MKKVILAAFVAFIGLAGLGCQHIAGVCDCSHPDSSAAPAAPSNPYPVVGEKK